MPKLHHIRNRYWSRASDRNDRWPEPVTSCAWDKRRIHQLWRFLELQLTRKKQIGIKSYRIRRGGKRVDSQFLFISKIGKSKCDGSVNQEIKWLSPYLIVTDAPLTGVWVDINDSLIGQRLIFIFITSGASDRLNGHRPNIPVCIKLSQNLYTYRIPPLCV